MKAYFFSSFCSWNLSLRGILAARSANGVRFDLSPEFYVDGSERCTLTATSGNRENEFCWGSTAAPHRTRCLPEPLQVPQQPRPPRLANPRAPKNIRRIPPKNHQSGPELDDVARECGTPEQTPHTATMSCRQWLSSAARQCQSALSQQQQPRSFSTSAAVAIRQSNTPTPSRCSSSLSD